MNIILIFCVTSVIPSLLNGPNGTTVHAEQNILLGNEQVTLTTVSQSRLPSNTEILIEPIQEKNENVNFVETVTDSLELENYSSSVSQILEHKGIYDIDQYGVQVENLNITRKEDLKGVNHENLDENSEGKGSHNTKDEGSKKAENESSEGAKGKGSEVPKDKDLDKSKNNYEDEIFGKNTNKTKKKDSYEFTVNEETKSEAKNQDEKDKEDKTPEKKAEDKAQDSVNAEYDSPVSKDLIEEEIKDFNENKYEDLDDMNSKTEATENCGAECFEKTYTNYQDQHTSKEENKNKHKEGKEYFEEGYQNDNQNQYYDEIKFTSSEKNTASYRRSKKKEKVKTEKKKDSGKKLDKKFKPDLIVLVIGFILALTSNFFMHIVRIYWWSVPQIQKNMIAIMNHYSVELVNLVITIQVSINNNNFQKNQG